MFSSWFPNIEILLGFLIFMVARFENQRWVRARQNGMMGSSILLGFLVDLVGLVALIFTLAFIAAIIFDSGWAIGLMLFFSGIIMTVFYSAISVLLLGRESVALWLIGTLLVPVTISFLFNKVTWFGWI